MLDYIGFLNSVLRHDILNILSSIIAYSEVLEENSSNGEVKGLGEKIREVAWKGVNIIKMIKKLEISLGRELKNFRLSEVIRDSAKGYKVEIEVVGDAVVLANEGIFTIFENLISNSVKHGRANKIVVTVKDSGNNFLIEYQDDGVGISENIKGRIFEKGASGSGGTGLGLYIVKRLVEAHGGTIWLGESEKGQSL